MNHFSTGHDVVDQIGNTHFEGNIIPAHWYQIFKMSNGKPDLNAIILLSEVIYWHRPTVVRDEYTGQIVRVKKKFKADLLQRSYQSFSDQFGFSKLQVKEAFDRLEEFGVIKRHFRTIESNNQKYNNVLFLELVTPVLFEMTTLPISKEGGSPFQKVDPPHFKQGTNTETTTEITTDINTQENSPENSVDEVLNLWVPDLHSLNSWLQRSGEQPMVQDQVEQVLLEVNSHYSPRLKSGLVTDTQMYSNFVKWLKRKPTAKKSARADNKKIQAVNRNVNDAWGEIKHHAPATDIDCGDLI